MIDVARVDERLFDTVTPVVEELSSQTGLDPDSILLVGAACRDILHSALGHSFPVRATTDTDLGIAVDDWTIPERIDRQFRRLGSNGIRYSICGIAVDIIPFGDIEDPAGISRPAPRGEDIVVFGFRDIHDRAAALPLPNRQTVRLPQPAGYAALKMRSWIDRAAYHGQDKDAKDLALAAFWYQNSQAVQDRLYDTEAGFTILAALDMDADLAAVRLFSLDIAAQLPPDHRADLAQRGAEQDLTTLARDFTLPPGALRSVNLIRRLELVAQLSL